MGFASELELEQRRGRGRFVRFQCEAGGAVASDEPWWGAAAAGGGGNWRSRRVLVVRVGDGGQAGSVPLPGRQRWCGRGFRRGGIMNCPSVAEPDRGTATGSGRSEERRVGKEGRARW